MMWLFESLFAVNPIWFVFGQLVCIGSEILGLLGTDSGVMTEMVPAQRRKDVASGLMNQHSA